MNLSPLPIQKFFDNNGRPLTGGLLFTYEAGTNNKIATYKDESGLSLNTNPVVLDYRGECRVWLDQELTYKFVLSPEGDTDPPTRPIWTVDNVSAAVTYASLTQQVVGQILYPRTQSEIDAGVFPRNYAYETENILRYLTTFQSGMTDCTQAIEDLMDVLRQSRGCGYFPVGEYLYGSTINVDADGIALMGESMTDSVLTKTENFPGIAVTRNCSLSNFTLNRDGTDTSAGITIRDQARCDFRNLIIQNQGSHGLWPQQTSLSYFGNIVLLNNGGDGLRLDATVAPLSGNSFVNGNSFVTIDCRGNAGNGTNFVEAYSNTLFGLVCQNNVGAGLRLDDARANFIVFYSEANTGDELVLTNNVNCRANFLISTQDGTVSDSSAIDSNTIFRPNRAGTYGSFARNLTVMKWICPAIGYDGNAYTGELALTHNANRQFRLTFDGFAGSQSLALVNSQSGGADFITDRVNVNGAYVFLPSAVQWTVGTGSPNGVVTAPPGSLYTNTSGGASTTLYVKESGIGNTGWIAK